MFEVVFVTSIAVAISAGITIACWPEIETWFTQSFRRGS